MYKVMIVDDEYYVRASIRNRTDWQSLELELVGEAQDGREALELAQRLRPDIVLTDIRMPEMDGLAFIREVRRLLGEVQFVILSGYDDFAYVKEAIQLQVVNYIRKPVDEQELKATLLEIILRLQQRSQQEKHVKQLELMADHSARLQMQRALNQLLVNPQMRESEVAGYREFAVITLYLPSSSAEEVERLFQSADQLLLNRALAGSKVRLLAGQREDIPQEVRLLACGSPMPSEEVRALAAELLNYARAEPMNEDARCAYSDPVTGCLNIPRAYHQALTALKSKLLLPDALLDPALVRPANPKQQAACTGLMEQLRDALANRNAKKVRLVLGSLLSQVPDSVDTLEYLLRVLGDILREYSLRYNLGQHELLTLLSTSDLLLTLDHLSELKRMFSEPLMNFFFQDLNLKDNRIVGRVQLYIHQHIEQDLKVNTLANHFYLNANYLSQLFKQETGLTLSDYVEHTRIERARALLSDPICSVADAAAQVGYPDAAHFSRVFKRATGRSPQKYRSEFRIDWDRD